MGTSNDKQDDLICCRNLVVKFEDLLKEAGNMCGPLVVVIDGLDYLDPAQQAYNMEWLPATIPEVSTQILIRTVP